MNDRYIFSFIFLIILSISPLTIADTFTITNTNDSKLFRQAMIDANSHGGQILLFLTFLFLIGITIPYQEIPDKLADDASANY